ncbi:MAG: FprA family A-type flavoprotein, partial [Candidatus Zipacnadales bacterium]
MKETFRAQQITERVWWVGAIDWDLRDFHGYMTGRGTSWNAYLIMGEAPILIDTVKPSAKEEMLARIQSLLDLVNIQYVVSNHTEMDHSGCVPDVVRLVQPKQLFASPMGAKNLPEHFDVGMPITPVRDLETRK